MLLYISLFFFILNITILIKIYCKLTYGICKCSRHLVGKVVIVTGANKGIGFETAKDLADRGARVILACRSSIKGIAAQDSIISSTNNPDVVYQHLDLSSLRSVVAFADNFIRNEKRLDILINNAGVLHVDDVKTEDGLSLVMQTNHFGPFLLTYLLLSVMKSSAPSRIINVTSTEYLRGVIDLYNLNNEKGIFSPQQVYKNSKMCNVLTTLELARRMEGTGVTANCLHPGYVATNTSLYNKSWTRCFVPILKRFMKTPWEGAQTTIYMAVSPEMEGVTGKFLIDCDFASISKFAQNRLVARKVWEVSEALVGIKDLMTLE